MTDRIIGIPAESRIGLDAAPAPDLEVGPYLIVVAHDGSEATPQAVAAVPPPDWLSDGFAAGLLARHKVVDVIVGEMAPFLYLQLKTYGLNLWRQGDHGTLGELVDALVGDELEPFEMEVPDDLAEEFRRAAEEG